MTLLIYLAICEGLGINSIWKMLLGVIVWLGHVAIKYNKANDNNNE